MTNTLLSITGPSLAGKTTLETALAEKYGTQRLISFTTRPQRQGEIEGEHYYFLTKERAVEVIEEGEAAEHIQFSGNYYGLLGKELKTKLFKGSCIAVVEPNGVRQLSYYCKENELHHKAIFLTNPPETLAARFLKRFKDNVEASPIDYAKRMVSMIKYEQDWLHEFNYDGIYHVFDSSNTWYVVSDVYHRFLEHHLTDTIHD